MIIRILKLFAWIFVIFWIIFYVKYDNVKDLTLTKSKTIVVEKWDNLNVILKRELWLEWFFLKLYLHNNSELKNFNLQVWSYEVHSWENLKSIIETLKYWSKNEQISLTILPWWNIFDIDEYLFSKWLTKKWEFIEEAKNIEKYKKKYIFLEKALTLEWFLYPDTHFVNPNNFLLENFINTLLKNFETKVYDKYLTWKSWKEVIETINMASIVEREERNINEKSVVTWILLKRLKEKWFIWADITACYAYSLTEGECKMNLSKYILEKNDYNTRTKVWLPKTPINNPSVSSIEATLNPEKTEYYYYLHGKDWVIHYAKTNEEHNQNKVYLK
jgi:UPF0755 protein